jgi:hypothetical protein
MQRCYYHPKIEAISHCTSCKLTVCFHCVEDSLCPECGKLKRFVQRGYSGAEPPRLIEPPAPKRSITMELMLDRLQQQVLGEAHASARPEAALKLPRKLIDTEAPAGAKRKAKRRSAPAKTRQPMAYGFLMPSVAPLIRVSRSPISRMALLMLVAFSLGTFFARQNSVSATVPPAEIPLVEAADLAPDNAGGFGDESAVQSHVEIQYKPVYIHVPVRQAKPLASTPRAGMPTARAAAPAPAPVRPAPAAVAQEKPLAAPAKAMSYPIASRQKFAAVEETVPTPAATPDASAAARLDLAFPHAGNTVRMTPVIRVRVQNPGKLALVNLAVDGKPIKAVPQISEMIEVPFDSTAFKNGEHILQVLAMEANGEVISSQMIPITIRN